MRWGVGVGAQSQLGLRGAGGQEVLGVGGGSVQGAGGGPEQEEA